MGYVWACATLVISTILFFQRVLDSMLLLFSLTNWKQKIPASDVVVRSLEVHFRSIQMFYQATLEDLPSVIIDIIIVLAADDNASVDWFVISMVYSIISLLTLCWITVKEVDSAESELI